MIICFFSGMIWYVFGYVGDVEKNYRDPHLQVAKVGQINATNVTTESRIPHLSEAPRINFGNPKAEGRFRRPFFGPRCRKGSFKRVRKSMDIC